ncbi:MAG: Gfo/Idh/MocA family oxidoreductase [Akkermansiaceae bacterium]|nr:Gfo/Idh/MocA family oxidoreductase [Akkermansiaceae bacterium]
MSIKVGVIGAGGMLRYHAEGFRKAGATVAAVADPAPGAAERAAKQWGIPGVFESVEAMLTGADLDAVSIIVPNKFHKPLAIQCLAAGKHVFSEKPPALNAAEVQEMIDAANAAGKKLMFNFNNRALSPMAQWAASTPPRRNGSAAPASPASADGSPPRRSPAVVR